MVPLFLPLYNLELLFILHYIHYVQFITHFSVPPNPGDCADLQRLYKSSRSGVFTAYDWKCANPALCKFSVHCDMEIFGGGWTVIKEFHLIRFYIISKLYFFGFLHIHWSLFYDEAIRLHAFLSLEWVQLLTSPKWCRWI